MFIAFRNPIEAKDLIIEALEIQKFDSSVEELDVKRVSFVTRDDRAPGSNRPKIRAILSLEGNVNNSEELFKCDIVCSNDYVLGLQNKIGATEVTAYLALENDILDNYSMTLAQLLNTILDDETTAIESYAIGDGLYSRLYADAGCTIQAINQDKLLNANNEEIKVLSVSEAIEKTSSLRYGEKSEEVYVKGTIKSITSRKEESTKKTYFTIRLVTEGVDELHEYEISSATLVNSTLKEEDLVEGATVICKGNLSAYMAYKTITK